MVISIKRGLVLPAANSGYIIKISEINRIGILYFDSRSKSVQNTTFPKKQKSLANAMFTRLCGGEGGIRTLDELLTHTRVPVVRHKPG